jgi:hypothetical protein
MVQWESPNELNAFRLLDANSAVLSFCEQPLTVMYRLDHEEHRHYPDILVETQSGHELWEVKPAAEAAAAECAARTRLLSSALPPLGFSYRVVLAEDLKRRPRLSNVLTLLKFGRQPLTPIEREHFRRILHSNGFITWGAGTAGVLGRHGRALIARSYLEGTLAINIDARLTPETRFERVGLNQAGD